MKSLTIKTYFDTNFVMETITWGLTYYWQPFSIKTHILPTIAMVSKKILLIHTWVLFNWTPWPLKHILRHQLWHGSNDMEFCIFLAAIFQKNLNISETVTQIKKVSRVKKMQNLISFLKCAIRFNVSSTRKVLFQFKKR